MLGNWGGAQRAADLLPSARPPTIVPPPHPTWAPQINAGRRASQPLAAGSAAGSVGRSHEVGSLPGRPPRAPGAGKKSNFYPSSLPKGGHSHGRSRPFGQSPPSVSVGEWHAGCGAGDAGCLRAWESCCTQHGTMWSQRRPAQLSLAAERLPGHPHVYRLCACSSRCCASRPPLPAGWLLGSSPANDSGLLGSSPGSRRASPRMGSLLGRCAAWPTLRCALLIVAPRAAPALPSGKLARGCSVCRRTTCVSCSLASLVPGPPCSSGFPSCSSVPIPKFQHPSHSLLEENGFTQMKYEKFYARCIAVRPRPALCFTLHHDQALPFCSSCWRVCLLSVWSSCEGVPGRCATVQERPVPSRDLRARLAGQPCLAHPPTHPPWPPRPPTPPRSAPSAALGRVRR